MSILTIFTLSPISRASSFRTGSTRRHGPHHSAQKSTSTGVGDISTSSTKVASVTSSMVCLPDRGSVSAGRRRCDPVPRGAALRWPEPSDESLRVESGGATRTGGGDRLTVRVVNEVTGGEDAVEVGLRAWRGDLDVPSLVARHLGTEQVTAGVMSDRDEHAGGLEFPLLA